MNQLEAWLSNFPVVSFYCVNHVQAKQGAGGGGGWRNKKDSICFALSSSFLSFFCLFVFVSFFLAVILPWSKKISSDVSSFFQKRETELKKDHWPYQ